MLRFLPPLLLLLVSTRSVEAQVVPTDSAAVIYAYIQGADTIAFEGVRHESASLRGVLVAPGRPRLVWEHQLAEGAPTLLSLAIYPPGGAGSILPLQETDFLTVGDIVLVTTTRQGERTAQPLPTTPGAIPLLGRSMLHTAYLAWFAQQAHRDSLTLFITSSGKTVHAATTVRGEQISLMVDGLEIITTWSEGTLLTVSVPSQALKVVRLARQAGEDAGGPVAAGGGRSDVG
ncbi:hypothetical protein [Gemmatimonas sp.]|uniref:hypothetical protein n=1 Tax=Gemmatimonas sp. TaxID=1962908 RepID=UPI0022C6016B|nr:hypothetical protein [Gemmatimonas sp.]MCZ8206025.1 hypothetical protein [Gemmatimonas sp.]